MRVGVYFALGGAAAWALSSTLLASQLRAADTLSASALRAVSAALFFLPIVFIVGAEGDIARMSARDVLQFAGTGLLSLMVGESLYAGAVAIIGMTRAFTTVVGIYNLAAFGLAALLLGESVSWDVAFGSAFVIAGVYLVSLYGRAEGGPGAVPRAVRRRSMPPQFAAAQRFGWRLSAMRTVASFMASIAGASGSPAQAARRADPSPAGEIDVRLPFIGRLPARIGVGILMAVAAGLVWGAAAVWLADVAEGFNATAVGLARLPAAAGLLMVAAWMDQGSSVRRRAVSRRTMWILVASGILAQGVASILFILALVEIGAGQSVVLFSTAPLIALPLGAIFLRERITVWVAVGTVLAVVGIALIA